LEIPDCCVAFSHHLAAGRGFGGGYPESSDAIPGRDLRRGFAPSGVDLTFATDWAAARKVRAKSKTPLESCICWWPFDSSIRKPTRLNEMQMLESDRQFRFGRTVALRGCLHRA